MAETIGVPVTTITTDQFTYTLRGSRTSGITRVTVNDINATLETGAWSHQAALVAGENSLVVRGFVDTKLVADITVTITVTASGLELRNAWNVLDEWGIVLGTPRLLGESNRSYLFRLQDARDHVGGSNMLRLARVMSRSLGLKPEYDAVSFAAGTADDGTTIGSDVRLGITAGDVRFTCREFRRSRRVKIENSYGTVDIEDDYPVARTDNMKAFVIDGDEIPQGDFEYDHGRKQVEFDRDHRGKWITLVYQYESRHSLFNKTLAELRTEIQAVQNSLNESYVTMTINADDTTLAAKGLVARFMTNIVVDELKTDWSRLAIKELYDSDYQEIWYNDDHAYNTKVEKWARQVWSRGRHGWTDLILDKDIWEEDEAPDGLPHLFDAQHTYWKRGGDSTKYDSSRNYFLGGTELDTRSLERYGVPNRGWKSGVGHDLDLMPVDVVAVTE